MYLGSGPTVVVMVLGSAPTIVLDISPAVVSHRFLEVYVAPSRLVDWLTIGALANPWRPQRQVIVFPSTRRPRK